MSPSRRTSPPPAPSAAASARAPRREWVGMPALQRVVGPIPAIAARDVFTAQLASWRDPSFLAPLGHLVGGDAPGGVIHDLVRPVSHPTPRTDTAELALVRRPPGPSRARAVIQRALAMVSGAPHVPAP